MILLDTDVVVDLLRGLPKAVEWLGTLGNERLILPGYVAMELVQGCRSKSELDRLEEHIREMMIVWPDATTCDAALSTYAKSRFTHGIGLLDALVGQLAISLGISLHTFNQKHYSGVPDLETIQPYQR